MARVNTAHTTHPKQAPPPRSLRLCAWRVGRRSNDGTLELDASDDTAVVTASIFSRSKVAVRGRMRKQRLPTPLRCPECRRLRFKFTSSRRANQMRLVTRFVPCGQLVLQPGPWYPLGTDFKGARNTSSGGESRTAFFRPKKSFCFCPLPAAAAAGTSSSSTSLSGTRTWRRMRKTSRGSTLMMNCTR